MYHVGVVRVVAFGYFKHAGEELHGHMIKNVITPHKACIYTAV